MSGKMPAENDKSHFSWHENFLIFHTTSNEKSRIGRHISNFVKVNLGEDIMFDWYDVGCGDCTQIQISSNSFNNLRSVHLFDPNWKFLLGSAYRSISSFVQKGISINIYPTEFNRDAVRDGIGIITAIHSLFGFDIERTLSDIARTLAENNNVRYAIIVAEHESSFIAICRQNLTSLGFSVPSAVSKKDIDRLKGFGIKSKKSIIKSQYLNCGASNFDTEHWVAPFILGESMNEFRSKSEADKSTILSCINETWVELGRDPVSIPDNVWYISV